MGHASKPNFSHSAQQAQQWVNELAADLGWPENLSHRLMRSVLQALRDWLSPEEAADLSSQLPEMIRGIYFEGWNPGRSPARERDKRDFALRISKSLDDQPEIDIEEGIAAVFRLLDRHLSHGEIVQVKNSMRKSLRHLWPE